MMSWARAAANFAALRGSRGPSKNFQRLPSSKGQGLDRRFYLLAIALFLPGLFLLQPLLLVGGMLLFLVMLTADLWARFSLYNISYLRELSEQRVLFGEEIALTISVENSKLLPLPWLELEDIMPRALTMKERPLQSGGISNNQKLLRCLFSLSWYERVTRSYTLQCNARGVHLFGPASVSSGDGFGFLQWRGRFRNEQYLLVYPLVVPLSSFQLPARHPFGDQRAQRRLLEDPSRMIGVRDYSYGDSLRRVDWKASARAMQLQSKIYESTTTYTVALFVEASLRLDINYGIAPNLRELILCAAASVADWGLNQGYAIGLYANTIPYMPEDDPWKYKKQEMSLEQIIQERRIRLPPSSSEEQRKRIFEMLARINSTYGLTLVDLLLTERSSLPSGATVVVITTAINDQLLEVLARLRRGGHAATILFAGDTPPPATYSAVGIHHLGGNDTWDDLEAIYSNRSDDREASAFDGFRL